MRREITHLLLGLRDGDDVSLRRDLQTLHASRRGDDLLLAVRALHLNLLHAGRQSLHLNDIRSS